MLEAGRRALLLQFEAVVTHLAEERGIQAALDEILVLVDHILLAMDPNHPDVARASAILGQAMRQLRSITDDHPLVRYGILPSGYRPQPAAAAA